jgi:hypothetical protein
MKIFNGRGSDALLAAALAGAWVFMPGAVFGQQASPEADPLPVLAIVGGEPVTDAELVYRRVFRCHFRRRSDIQARPSPFRDACDRSCGPTRTR